MTKASKGSSDGSPATVGGSLRDGTNSASGNSSSGRATDVTTDVARSVQFEDVQGHDSEEEYEIKAELDEVKTIAELRAESDELSLQVGQMGHPRPVERNLAEELGEEDDDDEDGAPDERPPPIPKAMKNADTPSANKVLAKLGEEMRSTSDWMMMFAPMAMAQAKWPVLGPELAQPVNSTSLNELVEDTALLLRAMGYRCNSHPNALILSGWDLRVASAELTRWKRKLRSAFGFERAPGDQPKIARRVAESSRGVEDPSKIPLPRTPETKLRDVFRATERTPYFMDSHMRTPKKSPRSRYLEYYDAADEAELDEDEDDPRTRRNYADELDESPLARIRQLSLDDSPRGRYSQMMELRTHAPLDRIPIFEGTRGRSEKSLTWLKHFIYEMKGARMPRETRYEPFSLRLGQPARHWYRQLTRKEKKNWNLLSEKFVSYYCMDHDQDAAVRYCSAKRKENEHICDFLLRLNGLARNAGIQYEKGGANAESHVRQFLLHCGDDKVMDTLYSQNLKSINEVEKRINKKMEGEKLQKQRDRQSKV